MQKGAGVLHVLSNEWVLPVESTCQVHHTPSIAKQATVDVGGEVRT